ncbi:enoyl-CoA hydratase-related protein [Pseudonocardia xishanensis]|uniref:Enoyl-CoA hydratase/isomerase family protein n=1 Tax=Pseudonocardia xishanensis TaxID=630995 RepID=A0ABP8RUL8_9PSEU
MDYERYEYLDITVADGVASVLNNDPLRDNAFTPAAHREWAYVYRDLAQDEDVRAIVLGGHGEHFSAGPDVEYLRALATDPAARARGFDETEQIVYAPLTFDKPVVSAISGSLVGGAATYALMADIIVADETATFVDKHVTAGLVPGDGGILTWMTYAGVLRAKRHLLTGDPLSAHEAERIGLITEVVPRGEALDAARGYAHRLAELPPATIRQTKRALNQGLRVLAPVLFDHSHALEALSMQTPEFRDWVAALPHDDPAEAVHPVGSP